MGKHASAKGSGAVTAAVIAGVIMVAGGGAWAAGTMLSDDTPATLAPTRSPTRTSTPGDTAASENVDSAAAGRAACQAQVRAADDIGAAVANSALHWKQHTDAYLAKTSGRITLAETQRLYATSKAFGLADEKAVAATTKAYTATGAACADATKSAPDDAVIKACVGRLAALDKVRTTGTIV